MEHEKEIKKLGQQLHLMRKANEMSQKKLAELVGVSREHVSRMEAGRYMPTFKTFLKVCEALNCELGIFMNAKVIINKKETLNGTNERRLFSS